MSKSYLVPKSIWKEHTRSVFSVNTCFARRSLGFLNLTHLILKNLTTFQDFFFDFLNKQKSRCGISCHWSILVPRRINVEKRENSNWVISLTTAFIPSLDPEQWPHRVLQRWQRQQQAWWQFFSPPVNLQAISSKIDEQFYQHLKLRKCTESDHCRHSDSILDTRAASDRKHNFIYQNPPEFTLCPCGWVTSV